MACGAGHRCRDDRVLHRAVYARSAQRPSTGVADRLLFVLFMLAGLGLIGWSFSQPPESTRRGRRDLPIIAGLVLPSLATIVVQWLFVRLARAARAVRGEVRMKTILCYGDSLTWGYDAGEPRPPCAGGPLAERAAGGARRRRRRHRRRPERPHHGLRRPSGRRGPQRRANAADDPDTPCAARPGHHHARRQRHEAVDPRQSGRRQARHAAAGRHRARPCLSVRLGRRRRS